MTAATVLALRVEGRVQGVGFRWFVQERATALGLVGWVWNAPDGAVELCAAGEEPRLAELRRAVEKGPPGARVAHVRVLAPDAGAARCSDFSILRGGARPSDRAADPWGSAPDIRDRP